MAKSLTLEQAIEILKEKYAETENLPFIRDRVSYALYYTWREVDEKNRRADNA